MNVWYKTFIFFPIWCFFCICFYSLIWITYPETFNSTKADFENLITSNLFIFLLTQVAVLLGTICTIIFIDRFMEKEVNLYSIFRLRLNSIFWGILWGLILIVVCLIFLKFVIEFDIKKNFISKEAVFYIFIFFVAAASEELFARGFILHNLYKSNKHFAILISSSIFALMHIFNSSVNSLALLNLVLAGILLSLLYLKNMNVSLPIGFHLGWNYFQGPVFGFQVSGLPTSSIFKIEHISGSEYFINNFGLEGSIIMTIVFVILNLFLYYRHFCTTKA